MFKQPTVSLATPVAFSLLALAINHANAQTPKPADDIYVMVTTAIHQRSAETALPVTLLTGDALHRAARGTLGDTLSSQPGISNASFGPAVGQSVIRGQQGRRVMNLTNSIANADASGNSADHAQTVEPLLANSIEVLRGPATLLYGGGAIGGVVNVIDQRIANTLLDKPDFAVEQRHDSAANLNTTVGSLSFTTGALVWHVDGVKRDWDDLEIPGLAIDPAFLAAEEAEHAAEELDEHAEHAEEAVNTDGYIANTGGKTTNTTGGVSWIFDTGHIGFAFSELNNNYGLPPGAHNHAHEEEHAAEHEEEEHSDEEHEEELVAIDMNRKRYDVDALWNIQSDLIEKVSYKLSKVDYQHAELENLTVVGTQFDNAAWQQRLQLTHRELNGWHGVIGVQQSAEEFGAVGLESFIPVTDIDSHGVFIVEDVHVGDVTYEMGARLNQDDYQPENSPAPSRSFNTTSFSGSVLWQVSEPFTVGLSLAHSERAPSIEELYSNYGLTDLEECVIHFATGACELGNTGFNEEKSLNLDLTFAWRFDNFNASVTLFNNDFKDYIAQVTNGEEAGGFPVRAYQQQDASFRGVEVDMNWQLTEQVGVRLFGDTIRGELDDSGDAPRMPPTRYGAELHVTQGAWSAYASMLHATEQSRPGAFELNSDSWTKLELGADYTLTMANGNELLLFVRGRNLSNDTIRLSTSYLRSVAPEAGRSVETGIRYRY
jgi:iron complex outermembrane recepter protein